METTGQVDKLDKLVKLFIQLYYESNQNSIFSKIMHIFSSIGLDKLYPIGYETHKRMRIMAKTLCRSYQTRQRASRILLINDPLIKEFKVFFDGNGLTNAMMKAEDKAAEHGIIDESKYYDISFLNNGIKKIIQISTEDDIKKKKENLEFHYSLLGFLEKPQKMNHQKTQKKEIKAIIIKNDFLNDKLNIDNMVNLFNKKYVDSNRIENSKIDCMVCIFKISSTDKWYDIMKDFYYVGTFGKMISLKYDKDYKINGLKMHLIHSVHYPNKNKTEKLIPFVLKQYKANISIRKKLHDFYEIKEDSLVKIVDELRIKVDSEVDSEVDSSELEIPSSLPL